MNLPLFRARSSYLWRLGHRFLRAELAPTYAVSAPFSSSYSSSSSSAPEEIDSLKNKLLEVQIDSLHRRILGANESSISTASVIEKWLEEGKEIKLSELRSVVKKLRYHRRFTQALKISDLMTDSDRWGDKLASVDIAARLELIWKVHGLEEAETYFNSLSGSSLDRQVYGAMLNCYAQAKQVEKAEAMMLKMQDSGFMETAIFYNVMLRMYSQMGNKAKLDMLMLEMERRGIQRDLFTYTIRLQAHVASSDLEGMEKLLSMMADDPGTKMDFHCCISAANGYLKAGLVERTLMMLKKAEPLIISSRKTAYECLITLYASIGHKDEVYRIWDLHKQMGKFTNTGYITMIGSLTKLNDIDGAEKIWEEWNSEKTNFDMRIPNLMIGAYCRKGYVDKAEAFINKIIENGHEPDSASWDHLAGGYRKCRQMGKAVELVKKAITRSKQGQHGRKPSLRTLIACLDHLKNYQGDEEAANAFLKMIKENYKFSPGAFFRLESCTKDGENINT